MPKVDAASRFGAASHEYCTRIGVRNNTLLHFTAFSSGVLAFAIRGGSDVSIIGVSIPYLSLFVVLLSAYHERTMYMLLEYQSALIDFDGEDNLPNWFSHEFYGSLGGTRLLRDWAQIYIILPISSAALLLIYSRWEDYTPHYRESYIYAVGAACICLVITTYFLVSNLYSKYCYNKKTQLKFIEKCNKK